MDEHLPTPASYPDAVHSIARRTSLPFTLCGLLAAALPARAQDAEKTLDTVVVQASADASGAGLTAPYAGGQVARGATACHLHRARPAVPWRRDAAGGGNLRHLRG